MSNKLVRLPNGNWVRPSSVIAVIAADGHDGKYGEFQSHAPYPPYVAVYYGGERASPSVISRETVEAARALADELAEKFNTFGADKLLKG